jgi:transcriptional regulator GlxA family with amidase domain
LEHENQELKKIINNMREEIEHIRKNISIDTVAKESNIWTKQLENENLR